MDNQEIARFLQWIYHERKLCAWCRHPRHKPVRRGLCSVCYRLALDFRRKRTWALAIAIVFATQEGVINAADWPINGLEVEHLFEDIARVAFRWRDDTENPFWHSANTWGESFSNAQLGLLFHYFSLVDRERERAGRRGRAWGISMELELERKYHERQEYLAKAEVAIKSVFGQ
jgi:hypothetical protein